MARSTNQKQKILFLQEYLLRNADEKHPVTLQQLLQFLESQGIPAERKSVYDDLTVLEQHGLDLQKVRHGSATGYYVGDRPFQLAELKLLVDSVQCSRFITKKKTAELIGKIENLASEYDARRLHRQVYVSNRVKTMNESIYYVVDELYNAIAADRKISFKYYTYTVSKERVFRRGGARYELSPFALMWKDENYYLVGYSAQESRIKHFRVDKMADVTLLDAPRDGKDVFSQLDMAAYADSRFGMFAGQAQPVRMEFKDYLASAVIDRFGRELSLVPWREGWFSFTVNVAVNEQFFGWLCSFGADARIIGPDSVAEAMRRHLEGIRALYEAQMEN